MKNVSFSSFPMVLALPIYKSEEVNYFREKEKIPVCEGNSDILQTFLKGLPVEFA